MTQLLSIPETDHKAGIYEALLPQLKAIVEGEPDLIANMANLSAVIWEAFRHLWTGFYRVSENELVLGPFQGPLACTRIGFGKGVCGTAWKEKRTIIVPDVDQFPGHIACSSDSRSEIVVPGTVNGHVLLVLDIDSKIPNHFDETDAHYLEKMVDLLLASSET